VKPILLFPARRTPDRVDADAWWSTRQKDVHAWQQGIEPVLKLIEKFTRPGDVM
jgi:hypothetical protein